VTKAKFSLTNFQIEYNGNCIQDLLVAIKLGEYQVGELVKLRQNILKLIYKIFVKRRQTKIGLDQSLEPIFLMIFY
jgi:hypothetical protein